MTDIPAPPALAGTAAVERPVQDMVRRRLLPVLSILAWFYVFAIGFLLMWVVLVSLLLGWQPTVITTGSMQPAIRPGDVVLQRPPTDELLSSGTVITFEDPDDETTLVTHRIAEVLPGGRYVTRGDANGTADSTTIDQEAVVGVGRLLVPLVGLPLEWRETGRWDLLAGWGVLTVVAISLAAWSPRRHGQGRAR